MANRPMPPPPPDPRPARLLRAELESARNSGLPFEQAWERAMDHATNDRRWRYAFSWSRDEWRACYERQPPASTARVMSVLNAEHG
jgi:hypothetical protein